VFECNTVSETSTGFTVSPQFTVSTCACRTSLIPSIIAG